MKKDYHIHAMILRDSVDSEQFILQAIAKGFAEICITDHMPLSCSNAKDRIPAGQVAAYCRSVEALAEKYEDRIRIKCGIEVDFHPSVMGEIEEVLRCGRFDYVLGSSHLHVFKALGYFAPGATRSGYARAMLENTRLAAESGLFSAIAHIDMYRWIFSEPDRFPLTDDGFSVNALRETAETALCAIQDNGLLLEINPHFAEHTGRVEDTYPAADLARWAQTLGLRFCYGSDAHIPEHVGTLYDALRTHPLYAEPLAQWEALV